jgi:large subunit ribosomal protein L21
MYAVFQVSGFQYRGEQGSVLKIPRQALADGEKLDISEVLLVKDNDRVVVGTPFVEGAKVEAEVLSSGKEDKIRVYKYKRRTKYRLTQGQRPEYTEVRINNIVVP